MKTMFDEARRNDLLARLDRVSSNSTPRWGKMNAEQMLAHLVASSKMALGELQAKPKNALIRYPPLRQLVAYWLPWPKGVPTALELIPPADCASMERSKDELTKLLAAFATRAGEKNWPMHPAFGNLGRNGWGILAWRHFDHHLRQFGV